MKNLFGGFINSIKTITNKIPFDVSGKNATRVLAALMVFTLTVQCLTAQRLFAATDTPPDPKYRIGGRSTVNNTEAVNPLLYDTVEFTVTITPPTNYNQTYALSFISLPDGYTAADLQADYSSAKTKEHIDDEVKGVLTPAAAASYAAAQQPPPDPPVVHFTTDSEEVGDVTPPSGGGNAGAPCLSGSGGGFSGGVLGGSFFNVGQFVPDSPDPSEGQSITLTWNAKVSNGTDAPGYPAPPEKYLDEDGFIKKEYYDEKIIARFAFVLIPTGGESGYFYEDGDFSYTWSGEVLPCGDVSIAEVVFDYSRPRPKNGDDVNDPNSAYSKMLAQWNINSKKFVADPVNPLNGNFFWEYTDLRINADPVFELTRYYNSNDKYVNTLGKGWRHSFEYQYFEDEGGALVVMPNGTELTFWYTDDTKTAFDPQGGIPYTLTMQGAQRILKDNNGGVYEINGGEITRIYSNNHLTYELTYTGGNVSSVKQSDTGAFFNITSDGVTDSAGRTVSFTRNGDLLTRSTNPDGDSLSYAYDGGDYLSGITDFMGNQYLTNEYAEGGKVVKQQVIGQNATEFKYSIDSSKTRFTDKNGVVWTYIFNTSGEIASFGDGKGETVNTYDPANPSLVVTSTNREGETTAYDYDSGGRIKAVHYPDGVSVMRYDYDANSWVAKETYPDGSFVSYQYNAAGKVARITDARGNATVLGYDGNNHLTSITDRNGKITTIQNNALGNPTRITLANGDVITNSYDGAGRLTATTTPEGNVTRYNYTAAGKLLQITYPDGTTTQYTDNANGYTTATTDQMGNVMLAEYNVLNQPTKISDYNVGNYAWTGYDYDNRSNLMQAVSPMGAVVKYEYDNYDNIIKVTTPTGDTISLTYDLENKLLSETDGLGKTSYAYDLMGRVTAITDKFGVTSDIVYDKMGRVIEERIPLNDNETAVYKYSYDLNGNITTQTDAEDNVTRYEYDREDRLAAITNALGEKTAFGYDDIGRVIKITDGLNHSYNLEYDGEGNVSKTTDPLPNPNTRITAFTYDGLGRMKTKTDAEGGVTNYGYDNNGNLISVQYPGQGAYKLTYDKNNNLTSVTDPLNGNIKYTYNALNLSTSFTDALGNTEYHEYDIVGNLTKTTDVLGYTTEYTYDIFGRVKTAKTETGLVITYNYDPMNNTTSAAKSGGFGGETYVYDKASRPIAVTDAEGGVSYLEYDKNGNLIKFTDANGNTTRFEYDKLNRNDKVTDAEGGASVTVFDGAGNVKTVTDAEGNVTTYIYDEADRVIEIKDAIGNSRYFKYDGLDRVTEEKNENGAVRRYEYDAAGNLTKYTNGLGIVTTYTYDGLGRVVTAVNALGGVTSFTYDANGNVLSKRIPVELGMTGGGLYGFTYDKKGNVTTATNPLNGKTEYTYNALNQVTSVKDAMNGLTTYEYDIIGNLIKTTDVLGFTKEYTYDKLGRVKTEKAETGLMTTYTYDAAGNVLTKTRGQTASDDRFGSTAYVYDKVNRPVTITDAEGGKTLIEYDKNGNITKITDANGHETAFSYDKLNRANKAADAENGVTNVSFDGAGNVKTVTDAEGGVTAYTYDAENQVTQVTDARGNSRYYVYDALGRVAEGTDENGAVRYYEYDVAGNLVKFINGLGDATTYEYDGLGRVVTETNPLGGVKRYTYDANGNMLTEQVPVAAGMTGNGLYTYTYDKKGNTATVVNPLGDKTEFTYNELNQTTSEKDALNNVTRYDYDIAGRLIKVTDALGFTVEYTCDKLDRVKTAKNQNNTVITYTYDSVGNIIKAEASGALGSDTNGGLTSASGALSSVTYDYDKVNRPVSVTDGEGFTTRYSYDKNGNIIKKTDPNGNATAYGYDKLNNLSSVTNAVGGVYAITRDGLGNVTKITDEEGRVTRYVYDAESRVVTITDAAGYGKTFGYDALNRVVSETDENGVTRRYEYDVAGNVVKYINGLGYAYTYTYDGLGRMLTATEPYDDPSAPKHVTYYAYDALGRVILVTNAHGHRQKFAYDALGRIVTVTDEKNSVTTYKYDGAGNVIQTTDGLNNSVYYGYDGLNRLISVKGGNASGTNGAVQVVTQVIYKYDGRGLVTIETNALGDKKRYGYDGAGNLNVVTDEDGNVVSYGYNALNLVETINGMVKDAKTGAMSDDSSAYALLVYGKSGELIKTTDQTGLTNFLLDPMKRIREVRQTTRQTGFEFDFDGGAVVVSAGNERVTRYGYDGVGNVTSITHPDGYGVTYEYNAENALTKVTDTDGDVAKYGYDICGNLIQTIAPNGVKTVNAYNGIDRLIETKETLNGELLRHYTCAYDETGRLTSETVNENGVNYEPLNKAYQYDKVGRLVFAEYSVEGIFRYTYDPLGNLFEEKNTTKYSTATTAYQYNAANQLTKKTVTGSSQALGGSQGNTQNGLPMPQSKDGVYGYKYDKRGDLIEETKTDTAKTDVNGGNRSIERAYEYNALGRMIKGTNAAGETSAYEYNALGLRVANVTTTNVKPDSGDNGSMSQQAGANASYSDIHNSWGSYHISDIDPFALENLPRGDERAFKDNYGLNRIPQPTIIRAEFVINYADTAAFRVLAKYDDGNYVSDYAYGRGVGGITQGIERISQKNSYYDGGNGGTGSGGKKTAVAEIAVEIYGKIYYNNDRMGSSTHARMADGSIAAWAGYDAWGEITSVTDFDLNMAGTESVLSFTTYDFDRVINLYFANARFFDSENKRFTQVDPVKDGGNWFAYCGDNPVNAWDWLGLVKVLINGVHLVKGNISNDSSGTYGVDFKLTASIYNDAKNMHYSTGVGDEKLPFNIGEKVRVDYFNSIVTCGVNVIFSEKESMKMLDYYLGAKTSEYYAKYALEALSHRERHEYTGVVDYARYDYMVWGWTAYWNEQLKDYLKGRTIDPYVIAAMLFVESQVGYETEARHKHYENTQRDVMQVIDPQNPAVFMFYHIDGSGKYTTIYVWDANGNETPKIGLTENFNWSTAANLPIANLLFTEKDGNPNSLVYNYSVVTPLMSIGLGVRYYAYQLKKLSEDTSDLSIKAAVGYNGGGDLNYGDKVKNRRDKLIEDDKK